MKRFQLINNNAGWINDSVYRESTIELRTTEMPVLPNFDLGYRYESCLFGNDDSEVLARYQSQESAVAGHENFCRELNLNNCVKGLDLCQLSTPQDTKLISTNMLS